ncbi:Proteasomal ubiquitin receptor ADRM1 [Hypsibius exemplaris]|uniref:Proteasomal ubiquitin receptor ADRM1 homolog n=1 Tax=Hypsibius exemplaris TaxID=2072580 RepID=A0A1W0WAV1_HYPEX|nr:Proteasomal ubiquitin receptor ADRM1 [Hypsibius exemplaris]
MALFGRTTQQRGASRYLVEFKAGRMTMEGKTVKADPRAGIVYIIKSEEDSLLHFCWKERAAATAEDDLIVFANDVELKKVPQCKDGRVFVLKVKETGRKLFYWIQEPDAAKDDENLKKVSEYLAGKTPPRNAAGAGAEGGGLPADLQAMGIDDAALQEMLGGVDRNQLMQLLGMQGGGGAGNLLQGLRSAVRQEGSAAAAPTATPTSRPPTGNASARGAPRKTATNAAPTSRIQLADLRSILGAVAPGAPAATEESAPIDWTPALSQSLLLPILSNPAFVERLTPHLPQDPLVPQTAQEVMSTIQSPQFQQAIGAFTSAFETRQLGPLIQEFNLGPQAVQAAQNGDFRAFVKALEKKKEEEAAPADSAAKPAAVGPSKPNNDDDEMSVD